MRFRAILTATVLAVALYGVVFERDRLLRFAGAPGADEPVAGAPGIAETRSSDAEPAAIVSVVVMDSEAQTIDNRVRLRGETEAARQVEVRAEISGLVVSEPIPKGARVAAGTVLCRIEPGNRPARLAEAEAQLAEARIGETAASRLAEGGFGSETRAVGAKAQLQAAQAAVEAAQTEIGRLTITAPFDGLLETDTAELGSLMQPGTLCATVIELDPIRLVGYLPEAMVDEVRVGAAATARLASGREIAGEVTFVARVADPDTRTFRVEVAVPNPDGAIRDGQSADIDIAARGIAAHQVPASALTLDDDGRMGLRIVDADDRVAFVPVRLVRDRAGDVLVTGLPEVARVIVVGQEFVADGVRVKPVARGTAS